MNKIQIKLSWLKNMLNSSYGLGQTNESIYTEVEKLKRKLYLVKERKQKIIKIYDRL